MSECEQLAQFMISFGVATGHGDTSADLLQELGGYLDRVRKERDELRAQNKQLATQLVMKEPDDQHDRDAEIQGLRAQLAKKTQPYESHRLERDQLLAELAKAQTAESWRDAVDGCIHALIKESPSLDHAWAGDKHGWGFAFEWVKWVSSRALSAEAERNTLRDALNLLSTALPDKIFIWDAGNEGTRWSAFQPCEGVDFEMVDLAALASLDPQAVKESK